MKSHDAIIKALREHTQEKPSSDLRSRVLESAVAGNTAPHIIMRRKRIKPLLAAAIIIIFLLTAAFTVANVIIRFGNSIATQSDRYGEGVIRRVIVNRSEFAGTIDYDPNKDYTRFDTLEDAIEFAPFAFKTPSYIPVNITKVGAEVTQYNDGTAGYEVRLEYYMDIEDEYNGNVFGFCAMYAGPDAYIDFEATGDIQGILIGDIEAIAMSYRGWTHLYWLDDEVFYMASGRFDLETMITIAESM